MIFVSIGMAHQKDENIEIIRGIAFQIKSSIAFLDYAVQNNVSRSTIDNLAQSQSNCKFYKHVRNLLVQEHVYSVAVNRNNNTREYFTFNDLLFIKGTNKLVVPSCIAEKIVTICHKYYNTNCAEHLSFIDVKHQLQKLHIDNLEHIIHNVINACDCKVSDNNCKDDAQFLSDPIV